MKQMLMAGSAAWGLLLFSSAGVGQSSFIFSNPGHPVFNAEGVRLAGSGYLAELYGGTNPELFKPLVDLPLGTRTIRTFSGEYPGFVRSALVVVPDLSPYRWAWLQMRAWDARLGATYEEVVARGLGGYGESPVFYAQGGNPYDYKLPAAPLVGLRSFSLRPVIPEPATWALLALGGAGVAWTTRRRR
jgi:hypothetical protein